MEETKKKNTILSNAFFIILLASYGFVVTMLSQLAIYGEGETNGFAFFVYSFAIVIGALLFALVGTLFQSNNVRRASLFIADMIFLVIMALSFFKVIEFQKFYGIVALCAGYIGGFIYYLAMAEMGKMKHGSFVTLIGVAMTFVLQLSAGFLQIPITPGTVLCFVFFLMVCAFCMDHYVSSFFEEILPFSDNNEKEKELSERRVQRLVGTAFLMIVAIGVAEASWANYNAEAFVTYGWTMMSMVVAMILVGYVADRFGVLALEKLVILSLIFSFVATYRPEFIVIRLLLFFFCEGVISAYLMLGFWLVAPATKHPYIWASGGNFVKAFQILFLMVVHDFSPAAMFGLTFAQATAIALLFWVFYNKPQEVYPEPEKGDVFGTFCDKYHFTPRERDVMQAIISSEDTAKALCIDLDISERMFYRYIRQMCDKVGSVDNRNGLVKKYLTFTEK